MAGLPYTPTPGRVAGSLAPSTLEQWAHDFAITQANKLANGTIDGSESGLFSSANAAKYGMSNFDPTDIGSGIMSGSAYNQLFQMGMNLASGGYGSLTPQQKQGLSDPTGLKSAGPDSNLDAADKKALTDLAIANLQESGATARNAADIAARMSIAQLQEAGSSARNAAQIAANLQMNAADNATQRYGIDVSAAVNREDTASRERIAAGDRTSREGIASADRTESARQFDMGLAEDRRQFNSDMVFKLFDRGISLMQNPVDWLGYQYWLGNIGAPINALTLSSAAAMAGAFPPSGPSSMGAVIGGPAVIDGDTSFAESAGITNAGPVSVSEALSMHPGGEVTGDAQIAASNTIQQFGSIEEVDAAVNDARVNDLQGQASPQFMAQSQQLAQVAMQTAQQGLVDGMPGLPGAGAESPGDPNYGFGDFSARQQPRGQTPQVDPRLAGLPQIPGGPVDMTTGQDIGYGADHSVRALPPDTGAAVPFTPPAAPSQPAMQTSGPLTNLAGGAGDGSVGGVYTGNEAGGTMESQTAATAAGPGAPAPGGGNIEQLLGLLATNLGMPIEQLRALFPANLMPGQASNAAIENSPVLNMLRNGSAVSNFNTAPITPGNPFTSIAAPTGGGRIETGIRGGQDVSATNYLTALPSTQQQVQGVVKAQGGYVPDFNEQILRSAPLTNISSGSYGRRRFGN